MSFDPYYEWLGIPPDEQPADHYRLLGIRRFERNPIVIDNAAERQMLLLKSLHSGPRGDLTQRLMNEVSAARICLLDPRKRAAYDARLGRPLEERETQEFNLAPPTSEGGSADQNLGPSDDDALWREVKLEPTAAESRWQELRLSPAESDQPARAPDVPERLPAKSPVSQASPDVLPAPAAPLPTLEPLLTEDLLVPVTRPRPVGIPKGLPKTKRSKVPRPTTRVSNVGNVLVVFGGLAIGLYIGVTLILMWIYGSGGGSRSGREGTARDPGAASVQVDDSRPAPMSPSRGQPASKSRLRRVPMLTPTNRDAARIG